MPAVLPNTTTTDDYADCVLGGDRGYAYGSLTVANNPVSVLFSHGQRGSASQTEYEYVTPSTLPLVGIPGVDEIVGVQVKSAIVGTPAQVSGWLVEPRVAGLQPGSSYTSTVAASGAVTPPGSGSVELAYVENANNVVCGAGVSTIVVGPTPALTFTGTESILAEFQCPQYNGGVGSRAIVRLFQDGVALVNLGSTLNATTDNRIPIVLRRRFTPAAGSHTYDIRILPSGGGVAQGLTDDGGNAIQPHSLRLLTAA